MSNNPIPPAYTFDFTGTLPANLVTGERQILTATNGVDYDLIIPVAAPYFEESLVITLTNSLGNVSTLTKGIDYIPTHWFISASRACVLQIYGSITILNTTLNGVLTLQYQTLGGPWTIDSNQILTILSDTIHNPRITAWEEVVLTYQIVNATALTAGQLYLIATLGNSDFTLSGAASNTPGLQFLSTGSINGTGTAVSLSFPPTPHEWDVKNMVGMDAVVSSVNSVADAINAKTESILNLLNELGTTLNLQRGLTYTYTLADGSFPQNPGNLNAFSNVSPIQVVVPNNNTVAFPVGTTIITTQYDSGAVNFIADVGVTIRSGNNQLSTSTQYGLVTLIQMAPNEWLLMDPLVAAYSATIINQLTTSLSALLSVDQAEIVNFLSTNQTAITTLITDSQATITALENSVTSNLNTTITTMVNDAVTTAIAALPPTSDNADELYFLRN